MSDGLRRRFWVELVLALAGGALCLLTIVANDWIELIFKVTPDRSNGSLEWLVVIMLVAATLTSAAMARGEWRRRSAVAS